MTKQNQETSYQETSLILVGTCWNPAWRNGNKQGRVSGWQITSSRRPKDEKREPITSQWLHHRLESADGGYGSQLAMAAAWNRHRAAFDFWRRRLEERKKKTVLLLVDGCLTVVAATGNSSNAYRNLKNNGSWCGGRRRKGEEKEVMALLVWVWPGDLGIDRWWRSLGKKHTHTHRERKEIARRRKGNHAGDGKILISEMANSNQ